MTTLHIMRRSAFSSDILQQCISIVQPQDTIVYCDDGCYNLTHALTSTLKTNHPNVMIKTVLAHAQARGITSEDIVAINMADLVTLTFNHDKVITWQ